MERKEQTGHICRWMALGIMTAIVIVGCTIVIGLFEWRDRKEIECRNAELHQWRKNVHDLNLHITELSLLGEMVTDWDSTDVNEYHSLRLEVDSMLEGIAGICPKEDSDTICRLLAEKEQLLLDIKDAMQELNATQEKLTAEVPRIVEQNKTESKRLSAMPQQAKPKKRGFFSRLFGKKENAVTTGNRLTQTEKMLTNLNQTVVAKHHQQSRKVLEILDSLGNRNEGINKQLQRVISIADENVDKGIKVRERQIADLEGNYTYYYIGMIGLLILVFFVLFLLVWRFAFKTRKSKEETRKVMLTVTHEMRSPLSAIKDYARKISGLEDATDESKRYADLIVDTSKGLTSMIDSFLVYSKLANGKATVKERPFRMMDIAEQLKMEYEPFAAKKQLELSVSNKADGVVNGDKEKVLTIGRNLLSNAMKFTPTGGEIEISFAIVTRQEAEEFFCLTEQDKSVRYIRISVTNTGENIPEEQLEKIFERFYQIKGNKGTYNWGTGIGLYYARSLARLHHGYLKAANRKEGNGAMFILILPADDFSYTKEERFYGKKTLLNNTSIEPAKIEPDAAREGKTSPKTILIVDDDPAIMHYLQILLTPHYHIISRLNSTNIFQTIVDEAPDLILSDVLMPDKDGYQLCKEIKTNLQFCHIPVVLVTAKSTVENQIEGLHTGADAYVPKPFEPAYLLALIESLLTNRDKMRSFLVSNTRTSRMKELTLAPKDEAFMAELYKLMENELDNPELDITRMAELLKISRTKFYYKVKGLTGKNPSVFFRTYKLNRAAELIKEGTYTISEIADMTGFNTLPHFSTCFKKQFGVNPSEYQ